MFPRPTGFADASAVLNDPEPCVGTWAGVPSPAVAFGDVGCSERGVVRLGAGGRAEAAPSPAEEPAARPAAADVVPPSGAPARADCPGRTA
jgi:hypothetical protein